ncbi:hypothetical protein NUW54_g14090 [Trametes sanguinea]|uniref:Uncharacterized protein n=1 Tax=Trametes sanguinea TaxID=158606 RepID=A0ACC1MEU6_9APHY|nr:hypothetical protein NUW54_g14090 [Trametes sanguinea]
MFNVIALLYSFAARPDRDGVSGSILLVPSSPSSRSIASSLVPYGSNQYVADIISGGPSLTLRARKVVPLTM